VVRRRPRSGTARRRCQAHKQSRYGRSVKPSRIADHCCLMRRINYAALNKSQTIATSTQRTSCCLRIGPRALQCGCANILTHDGCSLRWVAELIYLGVFIARARTFRYSLNYAKRSFFGAVNGLFGKLLNLAS